MTYTANQDPMALFNYGTFAPLDIKDLACPTWGLGRSTSADGTVITTIGPPFLPLIMPPKQALSLDPTWASLCTAINGDGFQIGSFVIFDPPHVLTPEPRMVPTPIITPTPVINHAGPTTAPEAQATPSAGIAEPATPPNDPETPPVKTGDPQGSQGSSSDPTSDEQPPPASRADGLVASHTNESDPLVDTESTWLADPKPPATKSGDPPTDPTVPSRAHPDQPLGELPNPSNLLSKVTGSSPQPEDNFQPQTIGLGAIIYNALGKSGPGLGENADDTKEIALPPPGVEQIATVGSQVLSINPSGVDFDGSEYSAGGPAITISNSVYTLVPHLNNDNDVSSDGSGNTEDNSPLTIDPLTIAGHIVVPNPSGILIDGSSLIPGGSPLTLSNTPVSLGTSGVLVIGSSSTTLAPQSVFTIGTQTFTADPAGFTLKDATVSPGGSVETVDGTIISLGPSGDLILGSSNFAIPTPVSTKPMNHPIVIAGQTVTPIPAAVSIAGASISAGGPAITLDGNIVSLGPSGALAIGSSTFALPTSAPALSSNPSFVIANQTITPNPSAFSIAGTTLSAGGPPVTVNGTVVSLQTTGSLIVGSDTRALAAPSSSMVNIDGFSVQAQASLAVMDGVAMTPGGPGVTVTGNVVSLESGGKTLDVGSGRFAIPTGFVNGTAGLQVFEGGQKTGIEVSLLLIFGAWIFSVLMV